MTVTKYREKYPDCEYCAHNNHVFDTCVATNKKKSKSRAKKMPVLCSGKMEVGERGG